MSLALIKKALYRERASSFLKSNVFLCITNGNSRFNAVSNSLGLIRIKSYLFKNLSDVNFLNQVELKFPLVIARVSTFVDLFVFLNNNNSSLYILKYYNYFIQSNFYYQIFLGNKNFGVILFILLKKSIKKAIFFNFLNLAVINK
jgi:hypothetical protein